MPEFVLPADEPYIRAFHRHEPPERQFRLDLPPDPWLGRWDAPVVVLLQNPSLSDDDRPVFERPEVRAANRRNLAEEAGQVPHYWLDDSLSDTYSGRWWRRTLGRLVSRFGAAHVAMSVLAVEMYGYRTRAFGALPVTLPSQQYALRLVANAISRQATIVLPRAAPLWEVTYPELDGYRRLIHGRSRNAVLSADNLDHGGFQEIVSAIGKRVA